MATRYEQYDYDFGPEGPLAALQARSTNPNFPEQIAPPKGWIDLVVKLDEELNLIVPDYTISQVKDKCGGLRFYVGTYTRGFLNEDTVARANDLIAQAEHASFSICTTCGAPATHDENNVVAGTRCGDHR
jgi:hypothetical protein